MLTLSNCITLLRAPLAFFLFIDNVPIRVVAVILAMLTDCIDGYIARRHRNDSRFGAILDPIMDKFFVIVAFSIFLSEHHLTNLQMGFILSRDIILLLSFFYLSITQTWKTNKFRPVLWGKITTAIQFIFLILLSLNFIIPEAFYYLFALFGILVMVELIKTVKQPKVIN